MKKGDIVRVADGSWSLVIEDGKLRRPRINDSNELWEIVAIGCKLPVDELDYFVKKVKPNDTILRSLDDNRIVFSQTCLLAFAHHCHTCPHCGQKIEQNC